MICSPYFKAQFEDKYVEELEEEEIANLVYSIYNNIKNGKGIVQKSQPTSKWIMENRNYRKP
jgi:hypothetical protein